MPVESHSKSNRTASEWSEEIPELLDIAPPNRLAVPIGFQGPGEAKVKPPGTRVRRGQPLVDHAAESSHIPLAPADGTLGNVRPIHLTSGTPAIAVELIVSPTSLAAPEKSPYSGDRVTSLVETLDQIRSAGVSAARHASPDLIAQLNHVVARPIDTLICTILDSDASLRLNAVIAARFSQQLIVGISLLARATGARRIILAVESFADPKWIKPLWNATRQTKFEIIDVANDYPQSDPTLMIYSLTKRRLRPGNLPTTQGVLILDAAAALAVGHAASQEPMLTVPLAVHDHMRRHSHFLRVPVGTTVEHVLTHLSIDTDGTTIRGGDLLRDIILPKDAVIAGGELTIHATPPEAASIPEPCIRCAWCIEACPTLVHPALILDAVQRHDMKMAERAGIAACIECGICSHVCPSSLPLLESVRVIRNRNCER